MVQWIAPAGSSSSDNELGLTDTTWDRAQFLAKGQVSTASRMPTAVLAARPPRAELPEGPPLDLDSLRFHDPLFERPIGADQFLNRRLFNDALIVFHRGALRHESYRNGIGPDERHVVHSVSKTLTTMMVGIAIDEGRMAPGAPIREYVPSLATLPAWAPVTLQHVLDMATGIATEEHYDDPDSMYWRYARAVGYYGRGQQRSGGGEGALGFVLANLTERSEPPGQRFNYASYLTNLLPYALEHVYGRPALELYEERLYARIGAQADCLVNVDSQGAPIVEGQVNLTLRDLARWALLYLHRGRNLAGEQVVPPGWIDATISPDKRRRAAFERSEAAARFAQGEYHNQTWIVDPARQRFAMLGIHGQFAYFDLPEQLLIAGFGSFPEQTAPLLGACRDQLWSVITEAIARSTSAAAPG